MRRTEVNAGMQVAVNDLDDGQVYQVVSVVGFAANLSYVDESGVLVSGGHTDVCSLRLPTRQQLDNEAKLHQKQVQS
jgi:hypothetical protein